MVESDPEFIKRATVAFVNDSKRFCTINRNFTRQYASLYDKRLETIRPLIMRSMRTSIDKGTQLKQLCDVKLGEVCLIIGTLLKVQHLKPSILKEVSDEHNLEPEPLRTSYVHEDDELILEDGLQRVTLAGRIEPANFVNGMAVGLLGKEKSDGKFHVSEIFHATLNPPATISSLEDDKYVLFASDIDFGGASNASLGIQLLTDFVRGDLGATDFVRRICCVVIAGNALSSSTQNRELVSQARYLTKNILPSSVEPMQKFDGMLARICAACPVVVMPGCWDPAGGLLPQQPLHKCMFPNSQTLSLHLLPNPASFSLDEISFLGCSGQNISDISRYSKLTPQEALKSTLQFAHMAPTAPDTIGCYPFSECDPFIIKKRPHVYFVGNQNNFHSEEVGDEVATTVFTIPSFAETNQVVLFNLSDLSCVPFVINSDSLCE